MSSRAGYPELIGAPGKIRTSNPQIRSSCGQRRRQAARRNLAGVTLDTLSKDDGPWGDLVGSALVPEIERIASPSIVRKLAPDTTTEGRCSGWTFTIEH